MGELLEQAENGIGILRFVRRRAKNLGKKARRWEHIGGFCEIPVVDAEMLRQTYATQPAIGWPPRPFLEYSEEPQTFVEFFRKLDL